MRVLLVDLDSQWRGGQSQGLLLLRGLRARGHEAELLSVAGSEFGERARSAGVPVHSGPETFRRPLAARLLWQLLRKRRFDVIHANEAHALTAAWLAGAQRQAPLVVSRRVAFRLDPRKLARDRYRAVRAVLAVSEFVARSVVDSGLPASVVSVVHDGVELPQLPSAETRARARTFWRLPLEDPLAGCVGYLLPEKGQEALLRALPAIRARVPQCRLLLAGDGPLRSRLERLAEELGVRAAVQLAGHVQDVATVYNALDVFVFPSAAEPLGSSLLSAMAYGLPVIAVNSGGVGEAIDAESGWLLAEGNAEEIACAAISLLEDRSRAAGLGRVARGVIERRFTCDHMVEATLQVYAGLAASGAAASVAR